MSTHLAPTDAIILFIGHDPASAGTAKTNLLKLSGEGGKLLTRFKWQQPMATPIVQSMPKSGFYVEYMVIAYGPEHEWATSAASASRMPPLADVPAFPCESLRAQTQLGQI